MHYSQSYGASDSKEWDREKWLRASLKQYSRCSALAVEL